jgi:hypothetical protein
MVNLYLDGCSFTYGVGLNEKEKLAHLFKKSGYNVLNFSRPGKSNIAVAQDTYNNSNNADIFVLGFTFSERFHFKYNLYDINLLPSNIAWPIDSEQMQGTEMENILQSLHKNFYLLFDSNHWSNLSDMLIDNTINNLKFKNKKVFAFSWQPRNTQNKLVYPIIPDRFKDGHLNDVGTKKLFELIQRNLGNP